MAVTGNDGIDGNPETMKSVIIYDDAIEFGGHERMTVSLIGQLLRFTDCCVAFVYSATNERLVRALEEMGNRFPGRLTLHAVPFRSGKIPTIELFWQFHQIAALARLFKSLSPSFVVVAQGNIELSVKGVIAARMAGLRTVSYLPSVRGFGEIGLPFGSLRDFLNLFIYRLIDSFILISENDCRKLGEKLAKTVDNIYLVRNLIDTARMTSLSRSEARKILNLPDSSTIVSVVGRVYFKGKGQDLAVRALRGMLGGDLRLLIVGDGPDLAALHELARDEIAAGTVIVKEWLDDPSAAYCASDIILMPSSLEGVPLVLLEALYFGKTVLASDIPPFDEYLPPVQRFPQGDADAVRRCIATALKTLVVSSGTVGTVPAITLDTDVNRESILRLLASGQKLQTSATS